MSSYIHDHYETKSLVVTPPGLDLTDYSVCPYHELQNTCKLCSKLPYRILQYALINNNMKTLETMWSINVPLYYSHDTI